MFFRHCHDIVHSRAKADEKRAGIAIAGRLHPYNLFDASSCGFGRVYFDRNFQGGSEVLLRESEIGEAVGLDNGGNQE